MDVNDLMQRLRDREEEIEQLRMQLKQMARPPEELASGNASVRGN